MPRAIHAPKTLLSPVKAALDSKETSGTVHDSRHCLCVVTRIGKYSKLHRVTLEDRNGNGGAR